MTKTPTLDEICAGLAGDDLTVPRERAMAIVGAYYCRVTGKRFKLDVHGHEINIDMPPADQLEGHISDPTPNARYFRHAVAELLKFPNEIGELVARDVAACRLPAQPFSSNLDQAFRLVKNLRAVGYHFELQARGERGWYALFGKLGPGDSSERFNVTVLGGDVNTEPAMAIAVAAYNLSFAMPRKANG